MTTSVYLKVVWSKVFIVRKLRFFLMDAVIFIIIVISITFLKKNKGKDISTQVLHELLMSTLNFFVFSYFIKRS